MITIGGRSLSFTRDQIERLPMEEPKNKGRFWVGVKHSDIIDAVDDEIRSRGWRTVNDRFTLSNDKTRSVLAGGWDIETPGLEPPDGMLFSVGVLNGNDRHHKLRLAAGGTVIVCQNGMVTGEFALTAKHTSGFDLSRAVVGAFDSYCAASLRLADLVAKLKESKVTVARESMLLMEAGRRGLMPWSRLGSVDQLFRQGRNQFTDVWGVDTYWSLLNCFTYVVKRNPAIEQMQQINRFRGLLTADLGLAA